MTRSRAFFLLAALFLLLRPLPVTGQADETSRAWNQPVEPYRIAGNLYYVGATDITAFLIATPKGHILLDGGFAETAPLIRESVRKLGFKLEDVKILLNSHAHYDHAGGLAQLKEWSGAKLLASAEDAALLARGGKDDYHFGDRFLFPPVQADRIVKDGERISLGGTTLTAHLTPGHTKGCTTWTLKVAEGGESHDAVFVCSATVLPNAKLVKNPKYPAIAKDYAKTFQALRSLPCDLFLGSHAQFYEGLGKAERLRQGARKNPFVDPEGYRKYVDGAEKRYREAMEKAGG